MFGAVPYKTKQFFFVLIKLSIVVGAFYFIYNKLTSNQKMDFIVFWDFLSENNAFSIKNIVFLMFLSTFNWLFEIIKWQHLASFIQKISFINSLEQSLGSLTASLFTPNRVGEYGIKAMYFQLSKSKKIVAMNLLSNCLQMTVTTLLGIIGLSLYLLKYPLDIAYYKVFKFGVILLIIVLFPIIGLAKTKFSIKGISFQTAKSFYSKIPIALYVKGFLFSLIRYMIFSFQFYFLLTLLGLKLSYFDSMVIITSMYFLASIIPAISIFDVVLKGSVAIFLFSAIGISNIIILSTILLMWFFNVALPSLIGTVFVLKFKFPQKTVCS